LVSEYSTVTDLDRVIFLEISPLDSRLRSVRVSESVPHFCFSSASIIRETGQQRRSCSVKPSRHVSFIGVGYLSIDCSGNETARVAYFTRCWQKHNYETMFLIDRKIAGKKDRRRSILAVTS
jgi:hypothetical protein